MSTDIATRLRELADLRAAATEGPWGVSPLAEEQETVYHEIAGAAIAYAATDHITGIHHPYADAAFIAASGSFTPAQLRAVADVVEAARETVEALDSRMLPLASGKLDAALAALDVDQATSLSHKAPETDERKESR